MFDKDILLEETNWLPFRIQFLGEWGKIIGLLSTSFVLKTSTNKNSTFSFKKWHFIVLFYIIQSLEYWGPIKECIFEFLSLAAIGHVKGWVWRLEEEALKRKVHKRSKMTFDSAFSTSFRAWNIEVPLWSVFLNFRLLWQFGMSVDGFEDLRWKPLS